MSICSRRGLMPTIKVDGQDLEVKAGVNLLEALLSAGIDLPYFCWHPAMGSVGACRQCAVVQYANDEDTRGRIVMGCMTPVTEGAMFSVQTENAVMFRDSVIENLMLNHPHDCPVCEEGGECHLQDMTVMVGHSSRRYEGKKTTFNNQYLGPFIGHEMNRCITCYRCVRYYQDYSGGHDLSAFASRDRVFFGRSDDGVLENEFAGNLVEVCPTGVFTDKTLSKHYTRKWDLQSAPTVCTGCALGCNTYTSERYGQIRRVHNRYHHEVNGYFLCDRGRFGAGYVSSNRRIPQSGIRNAGGLYDPVNLEAAISKITEMISSSAKIVGIGSPRASLEANHALRDLVGSENYCNGMTDTDRELHGIILDALSSDLVTPTLADIEDYDAILVLGEDVTNHAPRLALSIRQATRNRSAEMADATQIALWHDAAVRELAQHDRSSLIVATPVEDRLDEVASQVLRLKPSDISQLGFDIAESLSNSSLSDSNSSETSAETASIVTALTNAKRPLIVSGTSLQNANIMKAAVNVALALKTNNPETGLFLCASECNSVGVAILDNQGSLTGLLASEPDMVVLLENDLAPRLGQGFESQVSKIANLVVIDHLDNASTSASHIVLPAATFAEAEGTYVNNEGRAQRSMAVYKPKGDIQASYHLMDAIQLGAKGVINDGASTELRSSTEIRHDLVNQHPVLRGIIDAAPEADFRIEGSKSSRMTHRASGRTAMLANISVHEPKQPVDSESAMAFTMEGVQQQTPASLRAYTWSPGWNSNQSIHKFQSEIGGSDTGGDTGVILIAPNESLTPYTIGQIDRGTLVAKLHIFGSDELSANSEELSQLIPRPYIRLSSLNANALGVSNGDGVSCQTQGGELQMAVIVDDNLPVDCMVYPRIPATAQLNGIESIELSKITEWVSDLNPLSPKLITTDRTS
ncbi:MAG TPA: NADH-quinone oxidoreductase subunit NuoG [Gammaproteobacteria bacterium]|nr:NADH-quinone oxidoreductase subunit NuoG [Gammaproteobacteria bacterium]